MYIVFYIYLHKFHLPVNNNLIKRAQTLIHKFTLKGYKQIMKYANKILYKINF